MTEAIYDAGYNSNGRFYETLERGAGHDADALTARAAPTPRSASRSAQCSLGAILVAQSERGVCAIALGDDPDALARDLQDRFPQARLIGGDAAFEQLVARVVGFVEAPGVGPGPAAGRARHRLPAARVAGAARDPAGQTASYAEIAERIGAPKSVRAVAQACGANALAVAIPCHRVVRSDGGLSGYRWGVERKRALLEREARARA